MINNEIKSILTHAEPAAMFFGNILSLLEDSDVRSISLCCKIWHEAVIIAKKEQEQAWSLLNACQIFPYQAKETATFSTFERLLLLDGDNGTVACRIYGAVSSGTFPRFSDNGTIEFATRSFLRLKNLIAIRGTKGGSMVGPADYFGNLEDPHKYSYIIDMQQFPPVFFRQPLCDLEKPQFNLVDFNDDLAARVKVKWIRGSEKKLISEKQVEYKILAAQQQRQSLFLHPGLMEIDMDTIELNYFDPRGVDFSSFKAQLVKNDMPFQITDKQLPSKDEYRLVTYLYESGYTDMQVDSGSGVFLEKHKFSQTMTPLNEYSTGFVVLARPNNHSEELEMIGVEIPFGWTLIIHEDCIHGDTTLSGFFMMGMTSDHTTMRTADTVFLKSSGSKKNTKILLMNPETHQVHKKSEWSSKEDVSTPYVLYKDASEDEVAAFRNSISEMNLIFNPLSTAYWKVKINRSLK